MLGCALTFLTGLFVVQQLPALPPLAGLLLASGVAAVIAWLRHWRCFFFLLGILWASGFAMIRLTAQLPPALEGINIPIQGVIANLPQQDERRVSFTFRVTQAQPTLPDFIKLNWYKPAAHLKAGQHWAFTVNLKRPHGNFNLGGFDYERWLFSEGIGATGTVQAKAKHSLLKQDTAWQSITVLRQRITDKLSEILPDNASRALIKALTIGDTSDISPTQWDIFRKTGTIHLIVISGSHISLVAFLLYFLVSKSWAWTGNLRYSPQQVAALAAGFAAIFYAALAGFSVPTQRAALMFVVCMFAIVRQRHTRPLSLLTLALLVVLAFNPMAINSESFWLTFLFVAVIIYSLSERLQKVGFITEALKINAATSVMLMPVLARFFQQVSVVSPLANFFAVPLISIVVVPLSLLLIPLLFIAPEWAKRLFVLLDVSLEMLWWLLLRLAATPMLTLPTPTLSSLAFALLGMVILFAPRGLPARWLGFVLLLPLFFNHSKKPQTGELYLTLLDVGQGLAVVMQTANHWLVYDTGGKFSGNSDSGKSVLLPFLYHQSATHIDRLIISHGDNDHIGGAKSLLEALPTAKILTSVPQQLSPYAPQRCEAGQTWRYDGVIFTMLSPQQAFASENDNSCVLQIQTAHGAVLLTGDIEANAEAWLVQQYGKQLQAKVLIAPHHGSRTSSSFAFLQAVAPEVILIPSGYRNRFHHPAENVLARYAQLQAQYLTSANSGAITVSLTDEFSVSALRGTNSKYWNFKP